MNLVHKYLLSSVYRDADGVGGGGAPQLPTGGAPGGAAPGAAAAPAPAAPAAGGVAPAAVGAAAAATIAQPPGAGAAPGAGDPPAAAAAAAGKSWWPDDWRDQVAGADKDLRKQLDRYTDPLAVMKKGFTLEKRISAGELRSQLAADATPEQVKAWKQENGLPLEPGDYLKDLALPQGVVLGEEDKPRAEAFAKVATELNLSRDSYAKLVAWSYQATDQENQQRAEADATFAAQAQDKLREVWTTPADYNRNVNAVSNLMASMPEAVVDQFRLARMPNGNVLGNDPEVLQWMAQVAIEMNPAASILPANGGAPGKDLNARIAEIEGMLKSTEGYQKYWSAEGAATREEYGKLLAARDKTQGRSAA